jgi:hypothetical protein
VFDSFSVSLSTEQWRDGECAICLHRETIQSLIAYQLSGVPVREPLCRKHYDLCEGALAEVKRIQSPQVVVKVSAVTATGRGGRAG